MAYSQDLSSVAKATRCRRCGIVIGFGDRCEWCQHRPTAHIDLPGEYEGRHHTEWIGTVQVLMEEGDATAAELLLRHLIAAARAEADACGKSAYGWYTDQLTALEKRLLGTSRARGGIDTAA